MGDRSGQQFGNYRLIRLLGRGGFAEVYLGQHLRLTSQQAAIKILTARLNEEDVQAFEHEAETVATLIHPHIVRLLDFDVKEGVPFLVMDYALNGSLRQRHRSGEQVPLATVIAYVQQIAEGLQYAHDQKRIHRDIKPDNMLIGRRNEIVLSDFGIATIAQSTTSQSAQAAIGTISYMAPEQIQEHPRPASDQYALGITVYEWLAGERPFSGSFTEIAVKHAMVPPPSLRARRPELSPKIEQVVFTALAKDPKARFSSVQAFATALKEASTTMSPMQGTISQPAPSVPNRLSSGVPAQTLKQEADVAAVTPLLTPPPARPDPSLPITLPQDVSPFTSPEAQLALPNVLPARKRRAQPNISRRTVIATGAVAIGGAVVGGATWWIRSPHVFYTYGGHTSRVYAVAWSPDGKRIASGSHDATVQVWDATTGGNSSIYRRHTSPVTAVSWSPDGNRLASGSEDDSVQVWDATTGENVYTWSGLSSQVYAVAWSPDGKHIASSGDDNDNTVQVWDATTGGNIYTSSGLSSPAYALAWSPDGNSIASSGDDNTVQVWNATTGENVCTYHSHALPVYAVAWSPDGNRIVSGSHDSTVQVWDATTGRNVFIYRGHAFPVHAVAWSPDGSRIASGSYDTTVQVWDATTGGNVYIYRGHTDVVRSVAWSSDGHSIASGSDDRTVQVWSSGW